MIKARFQEEQPEIRIVTRGGKHYVFVCLNGERKTEEYDFEGSGRKELADYWEYDYCEGAESTEEVTEDEIRDDITRYIRKWTGEEHKTTEERISDLEKQNEFLANCLIEMSEQVYA